ncbi:MAG: sel1 repeat family protein [Deltaproteobacteria bacterium]|nr:sel1 repeat family protein [Deltaproteobacteria bacterium]
MTGMVQSHYRLGMSYYHGKGVKKSYAEAMKWFRLAAEGKYPRAIFMLGRMYDTGKGITENPAEAVKHYRQGRRNGLCQSTEYARSGLHKRTRCPGGL